MSTVSTEMSVRSVRIYGFRVGYMKKRRTNAQPYKDVLFWDVWLVVEINWKLHRVNTKTLLDFK
jgi:hypothetical protein